MNQEKNETHTGRTQIFASDGVEVCFCDYRIYITAPANWAHRQIPAISGQVDIPEDIRQDAFFLSASPTFYLFLDDGRKVSFFFENSTSRKISYAGGGI